jgi:hypothetical protein
MQYVNAGADSVVFDVRRYPAADFFRSQGLGSLCQKSWCDLDCPLAERWDVTLTRSQTLAGGAGHCDFRFCSVNPKDTL